MFSSCTIVRPLSPSTLFQYEPHAQHLDFSPACPSAKPTQSIGSFIPAEKYQKSYRELLRSNLTVEEERHYRRLSDLEVKATLHLLRSCYPTAFDRLCLKLNKHAKPLANLLHNDLKWLEQSVRDGEIHLKNIGALPVQTPADILPGKPRRIPTNVLSDLTYRGMLERRLYYHPLTLIALKNVETEGFKPLTREHHKTFQEILRPDDVSAPTYQDYGLELKQPISEAAAEESTTVIGATGLYTWVANNLVARVDCTGSYTSNNYRFLAAAARMQMVSFVDADGWTHHSQGGLAAQLAKWKEALQEVDNDPLLTESANQIVIEELGESISSFIRRRAPRLIGMTVKCESPAKAAEHVAFFLGHGVTTFRLYDAGSTNNLEESAILIKAEIDKFTSKNPKSSALITVFAGQITGLEQAQRLAATGAVHSFIAGIAEGGFCSTGLKTSVIPNNLKNVLRLSVGYPSIPVGPDGGVDGNYPCVAAAGAHFKLSGSIGKGTVEGAPLFGYLLKDKEGKLCYMWSHGGEASAPTKHASGAVDYSGGALNVEGEPGISKIRLADINNPDAAPTLYLKYRRSVVEAISKSVRFLRNESWLGVIHSVDENVVKPTSNQLEKLTPHDLSRRDISTPSTRQRLKSYVWELAMVLKPW